MKKAIKLLVKIVLIPLIIFINPVSIKFYRKIKEIFCGMICGLYLSNGLSGVNCKNFPRIIGKKYIKTEGKLGLGSNNRIECIDRYKSYRYTPSLILGNNVALGDDCHIGCINKIVIGTNTLIGSKVLIMDHSHGDGDLNDTQSPVEKRLYSKGPVTIGKSCWIGENVAILPNVKIGDNCIIGANSVVTKDIPDNCIAVGVPARVIKVLGKEE